MLLESILIWKFSHKNPKIYNFAFSRLTRESCSSHELKSRHLRLFGECKSQSWKRLTKIFKIFRNIDFSKRLRIFFQNLGLRVFSNSLGNSFVSQLSRKKHMFCKNMVKNQAVFQNFSLSLASRVCPFVFSTSPSLKTIFFTPKTSIILFNLHSKSKKRYGFSLLFILFQV